VGGFSAAATPRLPLNPADNSEIRHAGKGPLPQYRRGQRQIYRAFYCCNLYKVDTADGPVAQGIEQQPSKLKVAGSNPAGVATKQSENIECSKAFAQSRRMVSVRTLGDQRCFTGKLRDIGSRKKSRNTEALAESGKQFMRAVILVLAFAPAVVFTSPALAQDRTFGGFDCTVDCSGHSAGYKWAERKGITDEANCPDGNSQSFHEAGVAYTQGQVADPDEDDDGGAVGHRGRRHSLSSSSSAGIFRG
jgi:hypothetical protein